MARFWADNVVRIWFDNLKRIWWPHKELTYFPFGLFADITASQPSVEFSITIPVIEVTLQSYQPFINFEVYGPSVEITGQNWSSVEIDASEN